MAKFNIKDSGGKFTKNLILTGANCRYGHLLEILQGDNIIAYIDERGEARVELRDSVIEVLRG